MAVTLAAMGLLPGLGGPGGASAADLDTAASQVASGLGSLALETLAEEPPEPGEAAWERWARLRAQALRQKGAVEELGRFAESVPESASAELRRWVRLQAAEAELEAGSPAQARRRLARLVAAHPGAPEAPQWLRQIYRAYAAEGRWQDAATALRRHREVEGGGPPEESSVATEQARILMRAGEEEDALALLGEEPRHPEGRPLRIRLLASLDRTGEAYEEAQAWAEESGNPQPGRAWRLVADLAGEQEGLDARVAALERALQEGVPQPAAVVERTWEAYLQLGELLGSEEELPAGEDAAWIERADELGGPQGRALLAHVALLGGSAEARTDARLRLARELEEAGLDGTASLLYRKGPAFEGGEALSPLVRVHLGRIAQAGERLEDALYWMDRVEELPEEVKAAPWWLTRARLRVRLGRYAAGAEDLERILDEPGRLSDSQFRQQFLQVAFDLQQAERYATALEVFRGVYEAVEKDKARRELLYWMGECRAGLGEHREAANLFLRSAAHRPGSVADRWGRTARFQAARSLAKARRTEEARRLFRDLLGTGTASQDRAIQRRMNRLMGEAVEDSERP
ncbi:hypothetical protein AN478_08845 [Thiohalorhabdus denitrificans]|uniref:tetratricopeptide repeat protein n=1 Tax=Thiohalorhabdus denitrificans TaxID=381306 RepID=UPI0006D5B74D|nr:tetratricopeptide repeat protein [Thiohalorhabdus denitrificans]KPV40221.1 hypothetical protein AN478_08845 [Thiohalorhabdus denitrificans]